MRVLLTQDVFKVRVMVILLFSMYCLPTLANVIANVGNTLPAAPYLKRIPTLSEQDIQGYYQRHIDDLSQKNTQQAVISDPRFPVKSSLTPGVVKPRSVNINGLSRPVFVIGDDPDSLRWLSRYGPQLQALNAIGVITNIRSKKRYNRLTSQTSLALIPASLSGFDTHYGIKHYPFLLSNGEVEQ